MHVLVSDTLAEQYGRQMRAVAPGLELVELRGDGSFAGPCERVEAACLSTDMFARNLHPALMNALPELGALRWFHSMTAGVDHPRFRALAERGVVMTNSAGFTAKPIAQYVLAMMLRHAKRIPLWEQAQRERAWRRVEPEELTGQTVAILGVGGIGGEVARLASAFEMRVLGMRRTPGPLPHVDELLPPSHLHEVLAAADYVVVACPLTAETRGMIDAAALAVMKPNAYLINIARGAVIVEDALVDALRGGHIAGAALDVFTQEPLPAESPLWAMENVIVTPHGASISPRTLERGVRIFLANLRRYAAGEPLEGIVEFDG